jgi:hypothetical protein
MEPSPIPTWELELHKKIQDNYQKREYDYMQRL